MTDTKPVQVQQELTVKIINIGEKGDGIARHQDFVIIVPNTETGKEYKVKIRKIFNKWALAEAIQGGE